MLACSHGRAQGTNEGTFPKPSSTVKTVQSDSLRPIGDATKYHAFFKWTAFSESIHQRHPTSYMFVHRSRRSVPTKFRGLKRDSERARFEKGQRTCEV
eukprot:1190048-Prorocentrum_minimum.AAC.2